MQTTQHQYAKHTQPNCCAANESNLTASLQLPAPFLQGPFGIGSIHWFKEDTTVARHQSTSSSMRRTLAFANLAELDLAQIDVEQAIVTPRLTS